MDKMRGMVAIVTGSSRGLGRAIALEYGREGATVVACARPASPTQLPGTVAETAQAILDQGGESLAIACDEPSLFMEPGSRMLTAMLYSRTSCARHWLNICNAALLVQ